jgi:hypothetical protein
MMDLKAISLGIAVPLRDFDSCVHSVFPEAANLQVGKRRRLLTLVTADCADLPQGIRLETPPGFSFDKELHPGQSLICRGAILRDVHGLFSLEMRKARRWKCKLPDLGGKEIPSAVAEAWTSAWGLLDARQRSTGVEIRAAELFRADFTGQSAVARKMGTLVRELVNAARRFDPLVDATVAGLIGLGSGLTPSGDDFLVGFLAGMQCTVGNNANRALFLAHLGKTVIRISRQTNDISHTYLFHATSGQVSSRLATLAEAIARGESSDHLLPVAEDAMCVGHSSGMDTVTGLLVGLSAWRMEFCW